MSYFTVGTGNGAKQRSMRTVASRGRDCRRSDKCCGVLKLVFRRSAEQHAVERFDFRIGFGWVQCRAEDSDNQRRDRGHQRPGVHPVLVRPGHGHRVEMHRGLRADLAAGDRTCGPRARRHRHSSARSPGPTAPSRPPTTGTRCTPTPPTPPRARPRATASTSTGGVWHEVTAYGQAAPAGSSGGGGYGY